jgi:hypothetical protein
MQHDPWQGKRSHQTQHGETDRPCLSLGLSTYSLHIYSLRRCKVWIDTLVCGDHKDATRDSTRSRRL